MDEIELGKQVTKRPRQTVVVMKLARDLPTETDHVLQLATPSRRSSVIPLVTVRQAGDTQSSAAEHRRSPYHAFDK